MIILEMSLGVAVNCENTEQIIFEINEFLQRISTTFFVSKIIKSNDRFIFLVNK